MNKNKIRVVAPIIIGILILSAIVPITSVAYIPPRDFDPGTGIDDPTDPAEDPPEDPPADPPEDPPESYYLPYVNSNTPYVNPDGLFIHFVGHTMPGNAGLKSYEWDFGDGSAPVSRSFFQSSDLMEKIINLKKETYIDPDPVYIKCHANHTYSAPGIYTATLTVYDENDQSASDDAVVLVGGADWPTEWWTEFKPYLRVHEHFWEVTVNPDPDDPETSFAKKIWDANLEEWVETTSLLIDQEVSFKISFTADRIMHDVIITDYLPSTVEYVDASPSPNSVTKEVFTDLENEAYHAFTKLVWNLGDKSPGDTVDIVINGIVKYLDKEYFEIPGSWLDYPIEYDTRNVAVRTYTGLDNGCSNPHDYITKDDASFDILCYNPSIKLTKTANPTSIPYEGTVNYTYLVENIGDVDLFNIELTDDKLGAISCPKTSLAVGESMTCEVKDVLLTEDVTNVAIVTGETSEGYQVTDEDTATVDVYLIPGVDIEKVVQEVNTEGWMDSIIIGKDYEAFVKLSIDNTGESVLDITVDDTLPSNLEYVDGSSYIDGSPDHDNIVVSGQHLSWYFEDIPPEHPVIEIIFKVKALALGLYENWAVVTTDQDAQDEDDASIEVIDGNPGIHIDKKVLCNHFPFPDPKKPLPDPKFELIDDNPDSGDGNSIPWNDDLDGFWCDGRLAEIGETLLFEITVTYEPVYGTSFVDMIVTDVLPDCLEFTGNASILHGDNVYYGYSEVSGKTIYWDLTDDFGISLRRPERWGISEVVSIRFTANVTDCTERFVGEENLACVEGREQCFPVIRHACDTATVIVPCETHPGIDLVKSNDAECCVDIGETIHYSYKVTNVGDVTLYNVSLIDDMLGPISLNSTVLAPGDWAVGTASYVVDEGDYPGPIVNEATASGDDGFGSEVFALDDNTVLVCEPYEPDLTVDKQAKRNCNGIYGDYIYVEKGFWATFKIIVENTGDSTLDVQVCDILPDGLSYAGYPQVNGAIVDPVDMCWIINNVEPDEIIIITFRVNVDECGEHVNTVNVTGYSGQFDPIEVQDTATIFTICPGINVVKTADSNSVDLGELVTYTYEVTNTGNHHLKNVVLTDDKIPGVAYVSGDDNHDNWLDLDETWIYTASDNIFEDTLNTANVSAEDEMDRKVFDEDTELVEIRECPPPELDIDVVKSVKKNCCGAYSDTGINVVVDEWVTFKLEVTNTGNEDLDVVVVDTLPIGLTYNDNAKVDGDPFTPDVSGSEITFDIGILEPDETVYITFVATVECQICGELINTVNVTGFFDQQPPVFAEDEAFVFVLCPGINIVKTANPTLINPGDLVTYTYEITNTGNTPLTNIVVDDDQGLTPVYVSGDTDVDGWLDLDETWIYENTTKTYEDTLNIGSVTAKDELDQEVSDEDDAFVDVQECGCIPDISIDKKVFYDDIWYDDLDTTAEAPIDVTFKIIVQNTGTCDLENISIVDTMECGIENPRDITGGIPYEISGSQIIFTVPGHVSHLGAPIIITFNATVHIDTINSVTVDADAIDDGTHLSEEDQVTIIFLPPGINHPPYKPITPAPQDAAENVLTSPTLGVYVEDPDGDTLDVYFYDASDDSQIGLVSGVASGTRAETTWNGLDFETSYSWYAVADDGEYSNKSDEFSFETKADTGESPTVSILTPETGYIYLRNSPIPAAFLQKVLIIGQINITVEADDPDGEITQIDFIIDGVVKQSGTQDYFFWNENYFGPCTIKVRVTDNDNNTAEDTIEAFVINLGLTISE